MTKSRNISASAANERRDRISDCASSRLIVFVREQPTHDAAASARNRTADRLSHPVQGYASSGTRFAIPTPSVSHTINALLGFLCPPPCRFGTEVWYDGNALL